MFNLSVYFLILIYVVRSSRSLASDAFHDDLTLSEKFFKKLSRDYGSLLRTKDVTRELDEKISEFAETLQGRADQRHRRDLEKYKPRMERGVAVLKGFSTILEDPFPNVLAISVFADDNEVETQWFAAALDATRITLHLYDRNRFRQVSSYPMSNGSGMIADCSEFGCLLVINRIAGGATILRIQPSADSYALRPVQYIGGSGYVHLSIWHGMNQMYLGVASRTNVSIYHWLGEHFDSIQVLDYGAEKLTPFQIGGSLYLALNGARATVLKFVLQSNSFASVQRFPPANDVETFYMERGHRKENYLTLSNQESTVVLKFLNDHFVPFQKIAKADRVASITTKKTILLLTLANNLLNIYQYDGWKFIQLELTMPDVDSFYPTYFNDEIILLVRDTNGVWKFNKLIWTRRSTWKILRGEIKTWCIDAIEKAKRQPAVVPELKGPVRILRGHVGKLRTENINSRNPKQLINLTNRFEDLRSNFTANVERFHKLVRRNDPKFNTLYASKISGQCTLGCRVNNLIHAAKNSLLENLATPNTENQNLVFKSVKVSSTGNLRCPKPAVAFKNVTVGGSINGIEFESLQENLLKVTGDQEITGEHVYANLSASGALIPLEIAVQSTQQELHVRSIKANNLYLSQGGIFVPLNGPPTVVNGTKTAAKVRVTGPVDLRCNIFGKGVENLAPVTLIENPLFLQGNFSLQKVAVKNRATTSDLNFAGVRSLAQIINEAIPLDEDVPVHLKLSKSKTTWTNVIANITNDWIIVPNDKSILGASTNVTGTKRCPNNLTISNFSFETLPVPEIRTPLCALEATVTDVETSLLTIDRASAKTLKAKHIFGAAVLNATIADTPTSTQHLNLHQKIFTGVFNVTNAALDSIDRMNFKRLLEAMVGWREPGLVEGVASASNLAIKNLLVPNGFVSPPITSAKNLIAKGNIHFDTLNGIEISNLAKSVVKLDETASFKNVTFAGILKAHAIQTAHAPVDLSWTGNLGAKVISHNLKSTNLTLPYSFNYPSADTPANLIVEGSARFATEPSVESINRYNLSEISEVIWFTDRPSVISNEVFTARNMVLEGPVQISGQLNSKSYGPWSQISERILSLTKPQEIKTRVYLAKATVSNIATEKISKLTVPASFLDGLGDRSFRNNGSQSVTTDISFEKLIILGDLNTRSKINGMNLSTDIVRFDAKENIVTGKKSAPSLSADNINGVLNFGEWQKNTLRTLNTGNPVYIKGVKSFTNLTLLNPVTIAGLVNDRRMENYLVKSLPQEIIGRKKIRGTMKASKILINGLINDIDLRSLVGHQLKKDKPVQVIRSKILATGDVSITGNIESNGLYRGVELKSLNKLHLDLESMGQRMFELKNIAKQIRTALSRRAWYWDKLELIEVNSSQTRGMSNKETSNLVPFEGLGSCRSKERALICDDETVEVLIFTRNSSRILFNQVFVVAGIPVIVFATSNPNSGVWIYTYDNTKKQFHQIAGLNLPGATQASAIVKGGSLWLAVQLKFDTIILRYEVWGRFEEYTLPGTELFLMESSPTGELLIFRSDGVWRLGGLSGPRQLAKVQLNGEISTFVIDNEYYVEVTENNYKTLLKTRYVT